MYVFALEKILLNDTDDEINSWYDVNNEFYSYMESKKLIINNLEWEEILINRKDSHRWS